MIKRFFQGVQYLRRHVTLFFRAFIWTRSRLRKADLAFDPVQQFSLWYSDALAFSAEAFPNAVCLSTLDEAGFPDGRIVLLKDFDSRGFVFYTNTNSRKGRALRALPRASLTFYWDALGRQVRIQGKVELVDDATADAYFHSRPRGSRIGAWASAQSQPLENLEELERRIKSYESSYSGKEIPRPAHWTGIRVIPTRFEFWQLGDYRVHDRFEYSNSADGWTLQRLNP